LLAGTGGFWLSRVTAPPRATVSAQANAGSEAPGEPRSVVVVGGPTTARLGDDDRAALRALIREELASASSRHDAKRGSSDSERAEAPALSDVQLKRYDQARTVVDDGIAHGTWTPENRAQLRATLAGLPAETTVEIVQSLIVAVNQGKVRWEGRGPMM
jgi:hypothetical protein